MSNWFMDRRDKEMGCAWYGLSCKKSGGQGAAAGHGGRQHHKAAGFC